MRYFRCSTCFIDPTKCKGMNVSENVLHRTILKEINSLFEELVADEKTGEGLILNNGIEKELEAVDIEIESIKDKLSKTNERLKQIYYDKLDGGISKEEYETYRQEFIEDKSDLELSLVETEEKKESLLHNIDKKQDKLELIRSNKHIDKLDAVTVDTLIEKVEIGGNRNNRIINIYWKL